MAREADMADQEERIVAFIQGFFDERREIPAGPLKDPAYRRTLLGDIEITRPLDPWNGEAIFKRPAGHGFLVRGDVTTTRRDQVVAGLRRLGAVLEEFLQGFDRPEYDPLDPVDHRGQSPTAFIGFGASFFSDVDSGARRFDIPAHACPRAFPSFRFSADTDAGHDVAQSQTDIYVWLEASNRSLVIEGAAALLGLMENADWLEVRDYHETLVREDGRNLLGVRSDLGNLRMETRPSSDEVCLCTEDEEPRVLVGGTYLTHRMYQFDLEKWRSLPQFHQEQVIGVRQIDSSLISPPPQGSVAARLRSASRIRVLRREAELVSIDPGRPARRGLSLQLFHRRPEVLSVLYDALFAGGTPGGVPVFSDPDVCQPVLTGCYFLPPGLYADYPGHHFFSPLAFALFIEGARHFAATEYAEALTCYRRAEHEEPDLVWPFAVQAEVYHDLGMLKDARETLCRTPISGQEHHLYLEQLGWQHYLEGDYKSAVEVGRRAVKAYYEDTYRSYPYHDIGAALLELRDYAAAEVAFRRAVSRVNIVPKNCYGLGNALDALGRHAEAQQIYDRTVEVVQFLVEHGRVSIRDVRTTCDLEFIKWRGGAGLRTRDRIRELLASASAARGVIHYR